MTLNKERVSFNLAYAFILIVAAVYVFLAIAIVPYWYDLSGEELQAWFGGPFQRFAIMMVPVHFLSIFTTVITFIIHRNGAHLRLFVLALVTLLICQAFNFTLFATDLNPALQSGSLSDEQALFVLDRWNLWHQVRTGSVVVSALTMFVLAAIGDDGL